MPLPRLPNVSFAHHCPHCGTARVNTGQWFYAIGDYKCEGCGHAVQVTYDEKMKLLNGPGVHADVPRQRSAHRGPSIPLGEALELRAQGHNWKEVARIMNERHDENWHWEKMMEDVAGLRRRARGKETKVMGESKQYRVQ
jgi:hypothetical protein